MKRQCTDSSRSLPATAALPARQRLSPCTTQTHRELLLAGLIGHLWWHGASRASSGGGCHRGAAAGDSGFRSEPVLREADRAASVSTERLHGELPRKPRAKTKPRRFRKLYPSPPRWTILSSAISICNLLIRLCAQTRPARLCADGALSLVGLLTIAQRTATLHHAHPRPLLRATAPRLWGSLAHADCSAAGRLAVALPHLHGWFLSYLCKSAHSTPQVQGLQAGQDTMELQSGGVVLDVDGGARPFGKSFTAGPKFHKPTSQASCQAYMCRHRSAHLAGTQVYLCIPGCNKG